MTMPGQDQGHEDTLFRLDGKAAIVTGAAGLLGRQHALALSRAGASLLLTDLQGERCRALASEVQAATGGTVDIMDCDVTDPRAWEALAAFAVDRFGRIDILVNNAAYTNQSPTPGYAGAFADFPLEDWNQILNVNLTGTFLGCQAVGKRMLAQAAGAIINLASLYGVVSPNHRIYPGTGIFQPVAYSVSKAGVIALTRYLAGLWGAQGVRVNCITPGGVYNGQPERFVERYNALNPMQRMAQPEEMQGAVLYLASAASRYCNGHNLVVDGGWTVW